MMDSGIDSTESSNESIPENSSCMIDNHSEENSAPERNLELNRGNCYVETVQSSQPHSETVAFEGFREPNHLSFCSKLRKGKKISSEVEVTKAASDSHIQRSVEHIITNNSHLTIGDKFKCEELMSENISFTSNANSNDIPVIPILPSIPNSSFVSSLKEANLITNPSFSDMNESTSIPIPSKLSDSEFQPSPVPEGCRLKLNFPMAESEIQSLGSLSPLSSFNGPFCFTCSPQPYTGSMAVLPYESRDLQRKFKHYRRRLRQIISTKPKERKLRIAAGLNNDELVEKLLKEGVDPKSTDEKLRAPLHIAASKGYTKVVKLLLQNGADPNQKDSLGNTALHLAACTSHIETVTLLLKAGTDVKQADNQGYSPLHLATSRLKLLQKDPNPSSEDLRIQVYQIVEMMQEFLKSKGKTEEAELLSALTSKLSLSDTSEQVENDLKNLLNSLQDLTLTKSKKD